MDSMPESSSTAQGGEARAGLRRLMQRFARLRSAYRALPIGAAEMAEAERHEARADDVRRRLSELGRGDASEPELAERLTAAGEGLCADLGAMESDLLERFDRIDFVALRAWIPRAADSHPKEVIALVEILLADRAGLPHRLSKVEYLITILSTRESEGRRVIAHDPVARVPMLEAFAAEALDPTEAETVAVELFQSATLDEDCANPLDGLQRIRARKEALGLACLSPIVIRAVVTYNARMFNRLESYTDASRRSDAVIDEILVDDEPDSLFASELDDDFLFDDEEARAPFPLLEEVESSPAAPASVSVLESAGLARVVAALGRCLRGGSIGKDSAERIALALDESRLEAFERESILAEGPDADQRLVARTAVVGLMVRDLGAVRGELADLGLSESDLTRRWVLELNEVLGHLVSEKLADATQYSLASLLSGVKTKHLLAPLAALNADRRAPAPAASEAPRETAADRRRLRLEAASLAKEAIRRPSVPAPESTARTSWLRDPRLGPAAAMLLMVIAAGILGANVLLARPSSVATLSLRDLSLTSPYLASAYRSEKGEGGLVIGRVDARFVALPLAQQIEAATEMAERFEEQGIRDAMLYDERGKLQVHYASGEMRRPRPAAPIR